MTRILAVALSALMVVAAVPPAAFAECDTEYCASERDDCFADAGLEEGATALGGLVVCTIMGVFLFPAGIVCGIYGVLVVSVMDAANDQFCLDQYDQCLEDMQYSCDEDEYGDVS